MQTKDLAQVLAAHILPSDPWKTRCKIALRPYICPFPDLLKLLPHGASFCDIGCGDGAFLALLARYKSPKAVAGIEINEALASQTTARLKIAGAQARIEPFDGLTFPSWLFAYDAISVIDVLHHVPRGNQRHFVRTLCAEARPGTLLLFKDIAGDRWPWVGFNKLHDLIVAGEAGHEVSPAVFRSWLDEDEVEVRNAGYRRVGVYPHYWFLLQKRGGSL